MSALSFASSVPLAHLYLAVLHPATRHALRGMTRGDVREDWARAHHAKWAETVASGATQEDTTQRVRSSM